MVKYHDAGNSDDIRMGHVNSRAQLNVFSERGVFKSAILNTIPVTIGSYKIQNC